MAVPVPIPRLGPKAFKYVPEKPAFVHLTAQHLGNAGTAKDGFDAMTHSVMRSLADEPAIGRALDRHLADSDFSQGAFSKGTYHPIAAALSQLHTDGDKLLTDLGNAISPPASGGGGGGGGDGGGGGGGGGGGCT